MFCDPHRVGHFAVDLDHVRRGEASALFRLLVATTMFQRRQDVQIMRVLRGISLKDATELASAGTLLRLIDETDCDHGRSTAALRESCDLSKDSRGEGTCGRDPERPCHLKRHTVLLKRYCHFGKVPSSAALALHEAGAADLADLRAAVLRRIEAPHERARALEEALSRAWRVNDKIAAMFLSMLCNPDLTPGAAPWSDGIDWTRFVVIDSNVDLFLSRTGYGGPWTYDARRTFLQRLAERVDLQKMKPSLRRYNPRIIQQALYLFMSVTNRRASEKDCMHTGPHACSACPKVLSRACDARRGESPDQARSTERRRPRSARQA